MIHLIDKHISSRQGSVDDRCICWTGTVQKSGDVHARGETKMMFTNLCLFILRRFEKWIAPFKPIMVLSLVSVEFRASPKKGTHYCTDSVASHNQGAQLKKMQIVASLATVMTLLINRMLGGFKFWPGPGPVDSECRLRY